ncbi:hypothetical protein L4D77_06070 [Photobacterium frigidiphilum]|uniref:hypothetical protein n=1 Tax=Photobacterium frigidiphilum TaxID=264736 RepID=UPI003D152D32
MSRNKAYEQRQRDKGLEKITLWLPTNSVVEFRLAAVACCENQHLCVNTLRDLNTGRYVSLERPVTGDKK